jgi:hypothetical protein
MNKTELKTNLEQLLNQLELEENNVMAYFFEKFSVITVDWADEQNNEYERTMKPLWDAGDSLASAIQSLED